MLQIQYLLLLVTESLALVTYIPGNIFVTVKNIQDWLKNGRHSPFLQLILGVSGINIVQGLLKVISTFCMTNIKSALLTKIFITICFILTSCNLWFSTWLCTYYCLQTVRMKLKFYQSLQKKFPKMVPWLQALSILVSSVLSIPFALKTSESQSSNTTLSTLSSNATSNTTVEANGLIPFIEWISYVVSSLGFVLMFCSSTAIVISLCVNVTHVKLKPGSRRSQDAEVSLKASAVHRDAAKAVSSIVGVNVVLYAAVLLTSAGGGAIWTLAFSIANTIFQVLSCVNLIKGHVDISNMSICCLCSKKYADQIEN